MRKEIITGVPSDRLSMVTQDFTDSVVSDVTAALQEDGNYTITATFKDLVPDAAGNWSAKTRR